ncbi:DUF485 domain-containing protein [Streptomyces sp. NPDC050997]|uniref:DUF485 domain-containing protein n=1 Tax=Streptomyces sp. NPDC050997 TaxID=3155519 RepID=UPI0034428AD1
MQSSNGRPRGVGSGAERSVDHHDVHDPASTEAAGDVRYDDPWYDALASGWGESAGARVPVPADSSGRREYEAPVAAAADVYLEVQRSDAFQEVRSRYRRFVAPAAAGFFAWYLAYVVTATTAPGLMARPVAGAVNVAMVAGLGQFLTTFLLTWAYARHARLRRDRAALELRWDTQELTRGLRGGSS